MLVPPSAFWDLTEPPSFFQISFHGIYANMRMVHILTSVVVSDGKILLGVPS